MSALSAERNTRRMGCNPIAELHHLPVAASTKVYKGSLVVVTLSGYAAPAGSSGNTLGAKAIGVATETVDNSSGSAGDLNVPVTKGVFCFANSSSTDALTIADVGRPCFIVDDQTVARTDNNGLREAAGVVEKVDTEGVWIAVGEPGDPTKIDILMAAGEDLSAKQYYAVKSSSAAAALAGAGEAAIGVVQNAPASGAIAIVRVAGKTRMTAGEALASTGLYVASDGSGKAKAAVAGKVNTSDAGAASDPVIGSSALGINLSTAAGDGSVFTLLITHSGVVPGTAA